MTGTAEPTRIAVGGAAPYEVQVGTGVLDRLPGLLEGAQQVAVVHTAPLTAHAESVARLLEASGMRPLLLAVPDAEKGKTIAVAEHCWDELGRAGFTRTDAVVGVGGGAVTDLAGFVAACWLRGVRVVQAPTSLLAMVDAAIGGKTGVNTRAGKNLVGAFHPPAGVLCDLDVLATLGREELIGGLAEVIKCGFIADPRILSLVEADPAAVTDPGGPVIRELVERSIQVKADVVTEDLRESGQRMILNYGHTLGHAIERHESYRWRHGHAISVGLVYAACLARRLDMIDEATAQRHADVLASVGLPTGYRSDAFDELLPAMYLDKKTRGSTLRFVLLDGVASPIVRSDVEVATLRAAYLDAFVPSSGAVSS
ncbi:MAG: 3-dehydroquinate synthase [Actinocatenispora sp.]